MADQLPSPLGITVLRSGGAAGRNDKLLVFVDTVRMADGRIGGGQAGPGGGASEVNFGQFPQGIALVHGNCRVHVAACFPCGNGSCSGNGKLELRADANLVGVGDPSVGGEEFRPTATAAQDLLRQFPKRIAPLHAHGFLRGVRGGRQRAPRLLRANRLDRRDGLRGLDENEWRLGSGKYFWQGGNNHPTVKTNIGTNIFVNINGDIGKRIWIIALTCIVTNAGAKTSPEIFANVRGNLCIRS